MGDSEVCRVVVEPLSQHIWELLKSLGVEPPEDSAEETRINDMICDIAYKIVDDIFCDESFFTELVKESKVWNRWEAATKAVGELDTALRMVRPDGYYERLEKRDKE
jgi:hypothetical protein